MYLAFFISLISLVRYTYHNTILQLLMLYFLQMEILSIKIQEVKINQKFHCKKVCFLKSLSEIEYKLLPPPLSSAGPRLKNFLIGDFFAVRSSLFGWISGEINDMLRAQYAPKCTQPRV